MSEETRKRSLPLIGRKRSQEEESNRRVFRGNAKWRINFGFGEGRGRKRAPARKVRDQFSCGSSAERFIDQWCQTLATTQRNFAKLSFLFFRNVEDWFDVLGKRDRLNLCFIEHHSPLLDDSNFTALNKAMKIPCAPVKGFAHGSPLNKIWSWKLL